MAEFIQAFERMIRHEGGYVLTNDPLENVVFYKRRADFEKVLERM